MLQILVSPTDKVVNKETGKGKYFIKVQDEHGNRGTITIPAWHWEKWNSKLKLADGLLEQRAVITMPAKFIPKGAKWEEKDEKGVVIKSGVTTAAWFNYDQDDLEYATVVVQTELMKEIVGGNAIQSAMLTLGTMNSSRQGFATLKAKMVVGNGNGKTEHEEIPKTDDGKEIPKTDDGKEIPKIDETAKTE